MNKLVGVILITIGLILLIIAGYSINAIFEQLQLMM